MTVEWVLSLPLGTCLSTDAKPTDAAYTNFLLMEKDTGKWYRYSGSVWIEAIPTGFFTQSSHDTTGHHTRAHNVDLDSDHNPGARGDILFGNAPDGKWERLPAFVNTVRKFLRSVGDGTNKGTPVWDTLNDGDVPTTHSGSAHHAAESGESTTHTHAGGSQAFPVGAVFIAIVSTNPATLLGYGTWAAFGAGRVLVGLDAGDTDFDTAEETGGAKTVAIAGHNNHVFTQPNAHTDHGAAATGAASAGAQKVGTTNSTVTLASHTHQTPVLAHSGHIGGAVDAHSAHAAGSVVQPYVVCYFWKRIT